MALNLAYKIKKEEHFPATVSNMSRLKVIETIKQKLSGVQLKMFEASCFGHFLKMEDIQFSGKIVHSLLLRQLKDQPSNELWFGIGEGKAERVAKFTFAEWCLITGLSNFREVPKFDIVGFGKMEEILNGQTDITNAELETIFINAQSDDDELMVKLACLYFLECTLLGKERKTRIKREHIKMVEEFEKFNKFPWGKVSYEMTVEKMQKIMEGREKKKSKSTKKNPNNEQKYDVCGFALAFQVWAYVAIPLIGATCAKKVQEAFPRILSWKSSEAPSLKQLNDKIFARKSTLTVVKHLRPRTKELEFEYTLWCFGSEERKTQASKKLVNEENTTEQLGDSSRTESDEVEGVTPSIKDARDNEGATETSKSEEKPEPIKKKTMSDDAGYHSSISLSDVMLKLDAIGTKMVNMENRFESRMVALESKVEAIFEFLVKQKSEKEKFEVKTQDDVGNDGDDGNCHLGSSQATEGRDGSNMDNAPLEMDVDITKEQHIPQAAAGEPVVGKRVKADSALTRTPYVQYFKRQKIFNEFEPMPAIDETAQLELETWMNESVEGNERKYIELPTVSATRDWFKALYNGKWLDSAHMDVAFYLLRKAKKDNPTRGQLRSTTGDMLLAQHLFSHYSQLGIEQLIWEKNDPCVQYACGIKPVFGSSWANVDKVYLPLNVRNAHWVLAEICLSTRAINIYDSRTSILGKKLGEWIKPLTRVLPHLLKEISFYEIRPSKAQAKGYAPWDVNRMHVPEQVNGDDCGMFAIKFAEHLDRNYPVDRHCTQENMPYFRKLLAVELWKLQNT